MNKRYYSFYSIVLILGVFLLIVGCAPRKTANLGEEFSLKKATRFVYTRYSSRVLDEEGKKIEKYIAYYQKNISPDEAEKIYKLFQKLRMAPAERRGGSYGTVSLHRIYKGKEPLTPWFVGGKTVLAPPKYKIHLTNFVEYRNEKVGGLIIRADLTSYEPAITGQIWKILEEKEAQEFTPSEEEMYEGHIDIDPKRLKSGF